MEIIFQLILVILGFIMGISLMMFYIILKLNKTCTMIEIIFNNLHEKPPWYT